MATYKETVAAAAVLDADRIRAARESLGGDGAAVLDAALARAAAGKLTALTDKDGSPKLAHDGGHVHIVPGIVYMVPARSRVLGVNNCVGAGVCAAYDLCFGEDRYGAAGRWPSVLAARLQRTALFYYAPNVWAAVLGRDIDRLISRADRAGGVPAVRLNGLSDIDYRRFRPAVWDGANPFERWHGVQFYDYSRVQARFNGAELPANYALTFSLDAGNDAAAMEALAAGFNVAAVLAGDYRAGDTWGGVPIVDGDLHDYRFLDSSPAIVALKPKGPMRYGGRRYLTDAQRQAMAAWVRDINDGGLNPARVPVVAGDHGPIAGRVREPMAPR